ncbi:MAG: SDR family oxidoreductase, partial [Candidatus Hodarchaeales archaeon]|jgi:NADP-dependent 3-hydroxy acid dehydrogenase YdfG
MKTTEKVALVTGATKGIGKAICNKLIELDMNLIITARNLESLKDLKADLQTKGKGKIIFLEADLTKEPDIKSLVEKAMKHFGNIDVLINNAGVGLYKRIDRFELSDYNYIFDLNVKGVFLLTKYVVPYMIERKVGHIINISSIAGKNGFKTGSLYSASKHAIQGFTWSLREDVKEYGIKVTAVCPGSVVTGFGGKNMDKVSQVEWSLEPEDVAHAIGFLVTESDTVNTAEIIIKPKYNPRTIDWKTKI